LTLCICEGAEVKSYQFINSLTWCYLLLEINNLETFDAFPADVQVEHVPSRLARHAGPAGGWGGETTP
jgi:hypothetical protein